MLFDLYHFTNLLIDHISLRRQHVIAMLKTYHTKSNGELMKYLGMIVVCMFSWSAQASEAVITTMQESYRSGGATAFSASRGESMWTQTFTQKKSGQQVNCASCHSTRLTQPGSHIRTGKVIAAMAVSANADRFNDAAKIEKWFLRNCKWTMNRTCTAQEKGDFLAYFQSQ